MGNGRSAFIVKEKGMFEIFLWEKVAKKISLGGKNIFKVFEA